MGHSLGSDRRTPSQEKGSKQDAASSLTTHTQKMFPFSFSHTATFRLHAVSLLQMFAHAVPSPWNTPYLLMPSSCSPLRYELGCQKGF